MHCDVRIQDEFARAIVRQAYQFRCWKDENEIRLAGAAINSISSLDDLHSPAMHINYLVTVHSLSAEFHWFKQFLHQAL